MLRDPITPTVMEIDSRVLTAIFKEPGNDFAPMHKILEIAFELPPPSLPPAAPVYEVGPGSEDDAQTAHSRENETLLPHEQASLESWFHLSVVAHHVELKDQLGAREYRLFTMIGKLEE